MVRNSAIFTVVTSRPRNISYKPNSLKLTRPSYHSIVRRIPKALSLGRLGSILLYPLILSCDVFSPCTSNYEGHRRRFTNFKSQYNGFNRFDELPGPVTDEERREYETRRYVDRSRWRYQQYFKDNCGVRSLFYSVSTHFYSRPKLVFFFFSSHKSTSLV